MLHFVFIMKDLILCDQFICYSIRHISFSLPVTSSKVVKINLKADAFNPGKKNYEHARTCLEKRLDQKFNVIVAWDPPEENLCPSSVAAWFHKRGYDVSVCHQQFFRKSEYSLNIPTITDGYDSEKFFEWLGVFSISGNLNGSKENYVNTYECPTPSIEVGQVQYLQWTGFFTRKQLEKIYNSMKEYIQIKGNLWCSLHVQGFSDSPVSWDLKEHTFYTDGDNSYTILFQPNDEFIIRKSISSNNKFRISQ